MNDRAIKSLLALAAFLVVLPAAGLIYTLITVGFEAIHAQGLGAFLFSPEWNPSRQQFGAAAFITGTLMTSLLALIFCLPFSLATALFTGEYFRHKRIAGILSSVVDLLAGVPSIVFGLWGFYAIRPWLIAWGVSPQGFGILLAAIVLAIMILPYAASLGAEFIGMTSSELKEAAYALGATRLEVIRHIVLPLAGPGLFAAYILALGRALGETMAVTMLIGNTVAMPQSWRDTGSTLAAMIANQFGEADGLKLSALFAMGLLLFVISAVVNAIAGMMLKRKKHG